MISVAEAIRIVKEQTRALSLESVALQDALGRFLAEDIIADTDLPPFDRSQMDGYALKASDVQTVPARLRIIGESAAGRGWHREMKTGEAVRIMTGAPVPVGADSVQQVELTRELDSGAGVEILELVSPGRSIVKRAAEIKAGEKVLSAGEHITAATMAVLASFGYARVNVGERPRVAVLATGSELVTIDEKPGMDQIRDSNNFSIGAYAEIAGAMVEIFPLAGDDPGARPAMTPFSIVIVRTSSIPWVGSTTRMPSRTRSSLRPFPPNNTATDHLLRRSRSPVARSERREDAGRVRSRRLRARPRTRRGDASQRRGGYEL